MLIIDIEKINEEVREITRNKYQELANEVNMNIVWKLKELLVKKYNLKILWKSYFQEFKNLE